MSSVSQSSTVLQTPDSALFLSAPDVSTYSEPFAFASASIETLRLEADGVRLLDQTVLPAILSYVLIQSAEAMVDAIKTMIVRGAPAIGIAGAYGLVLSARTHTAQNTDVEQVKSAIKTDAQRLRDSRPTAVNLMWAIDTLLPLVETAQTADQLLNSLTEKALQLHHEDLAGCFAMGEYGAEFILKEAQSGLGILTHCNAGGLATTGYGTALGVIRSLYRRDNNLRVFADETRPRLQGAKLTAWELHQDNIPVTLICDGMAASLMREGKIQAVVVGADRIASNGDTANKIGTYSLAIVAKAHRVPFYVAAPCSTIDMSLQTGQQIPIEHRHPDEIALVGNERICPEGIAFYNPAFDVTPANLITAIFTEKGVATADYQQSLAEFFA